uniref:Uncharacterized protein n=1 Tax=Anguilla anguilla TaxID=7936 RepID=A0A0E9U921_ANGAN
MFGSISAPPPMAPQTPGDLMWY